MTSNIDRRAVLLGAGAALASPAVLRAQGATLVFTAIPDQDETRLVERFSRVATFFQSALGVTARYVPVKTYPAAVTAFINNEVQLAWFGGLTHVQARLAVPGTRAIAQGEEDNTFTSYFIANARTGLTRSETFPAGLAGKTFTFGARTSTSGRLMPEFHIRRALGRAPEAAFARVGFSGDHSRTIQLVQSGAFETGAVDYTVYDLEKEQGRFDEAQVRIVWETPPFPNYNWTVRGDADARLGAGFTDRLQAALVGLTDRAILDAFPRTRFIPATNADFDPIAEVARAAGLLA
jgi:phosphonate transport system substrate-binding protein